MNIELALEVVGAIELYPDSHNQDSWCSVSRKGAPVTAEEMLSEPPCGTTLCFAGWAAAISAPEGAVFSWGDTAGVFTPYKVGDYVWDKDGFMVLYDSYPYPPSKRSVRYNRHGIAEYARKALGINSYQSGYLFDPSRTVDELLSGVRCLIANSHASVDDMRVFYREERMHLPH